MEKAPSFKVPNFNIPDMKSGKHLPDAKAASNLTHGNVASTVVSHFVHLQNKQIMADNAISRDDQNNNIPDVKSAKRFPDATTANNLTHGNVNLLTFSYRIENEDFILKYICIISVILLIISIAIVPIVTYNNNEDNAIYNDLM
ncbi:hypothetical protein CDAR_536101 [Caerostris darwini]|uniref:Uncharacterized protein n=1 Tax=Caerostris darwini TaxID=1538125 RepID=A0AAV4V853_9ARAC|nr:hypothetical protein CDAR_536101 [Caerostris darwini]